jgi:regulator of RNase E activity RraA
VAKVTGIAGLVISGAWLTANESNCLDIEIKKRGIVKHGADQVDKVLQEQ